MRVIYDIGDRIRIPSGYEGTVMEVTITGDGVIRYLVHTDDRQLAYLAGSTVEPVLVKGIIHRCPACGQEFGDPIP